MRLVRYLAHCGVASRRAAGELVKKGQVQVNGRTCANVAFLVEPDDRVRVGGKPVRFPSASTVLLLHKPAGVICSLRDPHHPKTVLSCLPPRLRPRLKPVGRLDKKTTGLLLLTDDGELLNRLTHPRYGVEKTYRATVAGQVSDASLEILRNGVELEDGLTSPARVCRMPHPMRKRRGIPDGSDIGGSEPLSPRERGRGEGRYPARHSEKRTTALPVSSSSASPPRQSSGFSLPAPPNQTVLELTIHEGRKRQVRRMCEAVGHPALRLERTRYGPLSLGDLQPGAHRPLTPAELAQLRRATGLS